MKIFEFVNEYLEFKQICVNEGKVFEIEEIVKLFEVWIKNK